MSTLYAASPIAYTCGGQPLAPISLSMYVDITLSLRSRGSGEGLHGRVSGHRVSGHGRCEPGVRAHPGATAEPIRGAAFEVGRDPRAPRAPEHESRVSWCHRIALEPKGWRDGR